MLVHRARDIHKCLKNIGNFTDDQAQVVSWDSDHLEWITIQILPKGGPYAGGKYSFMIRFDKQYPKQPPQVDCITPIYHPNIDMTGEDYNVCLSLFDEWLPSFGLEDVIQGLLFLLYYPNLDDPLSPWFDPSMDVTEFAQNLKKTLQGEVIEDALNFEFPRMIEKEAESKLESAETENKLESAVTENKLESAEIETKLESVECVEVDEVNKNDCDDICGSLPGMVLKESDVKGNSIAVNNNEKCFSAEENCITIDKGNHKDTDENTEGTVDKEDDKKLQSPGVTDLNSKEGDAITPLESTCNHNDMVTYIEDNFLTGFSELMAIDLFSDDDNLTEFSDEDYDETYSEDLELDDQDSDDMSDAESYLSCENEKSFLSSWRFKVFSMIRSVISQHLRIVAWPQTSDNTTHTLDTLDTVMKGSCIQTCVDTGSSFCEDEDLEELYLFLLSRSQSSDIISRHSSDTEDWSLATGETASTVFTDTLDSTQCTDCSTTPAYNVVLRDAAFLACCRMLSKIIPNRRMASIAPFCVYAFFAWKYVEYVR